MRSHLATHAVLHNSPHLACPPPFPPVTQAFLAQMAPLKPWTCKWWQITQCELLRQKYLQFVVVGGVRDVCMQYGVGFVATLPQRARPLVS